MNFDYLSIGEKAYSWAKDLWPICRSLTGEGVRQTLIYLQNEIPELKIKSVSSGEQYFDWEVPEEWSIRKAYIVGPDGTRVIDFQNHNLHVVGYSTPIRQKMSLEELRPHLYSLPEQPDAIPYVTSYYSKRWGFCISHRQLETLVEGEYEVVIDSDHQKGVLNYGEVYLRGKTDREIFISTYICHPSMANNELSGPVVTTALLQWLSSLTQRKYSYRVVFIPETIGSVIYTAQNLEILKSKVDAGFNVSCVGDERSYSYLPSRNGKTLADRVALHTIQNIDSNFVKYSFLDRGSDERQYCSPGVDLPVCSLMRTKYGAYPEYHTSLDDLSLVTPRGLAGGFEVLQKAILTLENNAYPKVEVLCEPQLGKRGLYPTISAKGSANSVLDMMNLIAYCDGTRDLVEIAEIIGVNVLELIPVVEKLKAHQLLSVSDFPLK